MVKEEKNNNMALIAIVAIVAVVGLISLVMMQGSKAPAYTTTNNEAAIGEAYRALLDDRAELSSGDTCKGKVYANCFAPDCWWNNELHKCIPN